MRVFKNGIIGKIWILMRYIKIFVVWVRGVVFIVGIE